MNDKKLGQSPAFPTLHREDIPIGGDLGISKRLWIATHIVANIYPSVNINAPKEDVNRALVTICYELVDELLKQENE